MKAILVGVPTDVPKEHDLVTLFNALPERMRHYFSRRFDAATEADPQKVRMRIESMFLLTDKEQELQVTGDITVLDPTLEQLLERNRNGFIHSRYLFEAARRDEVRIYRYEYGRLALICSILCETLEHDLQNRPSSYSRTFNF